MNRLQIIRQKEKEYHDACYENHVFFQPGSWLHKPVKTIMDLMSHFDDKSEIDVLDLGSGVGRNSIPIAVKLKQKKGKVVCVDFLDSAISKLQQYSHHYGVKDQICPILSEISKYRIREASFDFIFSVSALEHLESEEVFDRVLEGMIKGTKLHGLNCIIISTNIRETIIESGEPIEPMFELLFDTDYLIHKFESMYNGWELIKKTVKSYGAEIARDGKKVFLESNVITWAVRKV
jgi:2-polyprenyl-3-methyl-5-hydroxy-6-metoxy-1,4-benzoquinol methylase